MLFFLFIYLLGLGCLLEPKMLLANTSDTPSTAAALMEERYQMRITQPAQTAFQTSSTLLPQPKAYPRRDFPESESVLERREPIAKAPSTDQSTEPNALVDDSSALDHSNHRRPVVTSSSHVVTSMRPRYNVERRATLITKHEKHAVKRVLANHTLLTKLFYEPSDKPRPAFAFLTKARESALKAPHLQTSVSEEDFNSDRRGGSELATTRAAKQPAGLNSLFLATQIPELLTTEARDWLTKQKPTASETSPLVTSRASASIGSRVSKPSRSVVEVQEAASSIKQIPTTSESPRPSFMSHTSAFTSSRASKPSRSIVQKSVKQVPPSTAKQTPIEAPQSTSPSPSQLINNMSGHSSRSTVQVATTPESSTEPLRSTPGQSTPPKQSPVVPPPTSAFQSDLSPLSSMKIGKPSITPNVKPQITSEVSSPTVSGQVPTITTDLSSTEAISASSKAQSQSNPRPSISLISKQASPLTNERGSRTSTFESHAPTLSGSKGTQITKETPGPIRSTDRRTTGSNQAPQAENTQTLVPSLRGSTPTSVKQNPVAVGKAGPSVSSSLSAHTRFGAAILSNIGQIGGTVVPPREPKSHSGSGKVTPTDLSSLASKTPTANSQRGGNTENPAVPTPFKSAGLTINTIPPTSKSSIMQSEEFSSSSGSVKVTSISQSSHSIKAQVVISQKGTSRANLAVTAPSPEAELTGSSSPQGLVRSTTSISKVPISGPSAGVMASTKQSDSASMAVKTDSFEISTSTRVEDSPEPTMTAPRSQSGSQDSVTSNFITGLRPHTHISSSVGHTQAITEASSEMAAVLTSRQQVLTTHISIISPASQIRRLEASGITIGDSKVSASNSRLIASANVGTTNLVSSLHTLETKSASAKAGGVVLAGEGTTELPRSSQSMISLSSAVAALPDSSQITGASAAVSVRPSSHTVQINSAIVKAGGLDIMSDNTAALQRSDLPSAISAPAGSSRTMGASAALTVSQSSRVMSGSDISSTFIPSTALRSATVTNAETILPSSSSSWPLTRLDSITTSSSSNQGANTREFQSTALSLSTTIPSRTTVSSFSNPLSKESTISRSASTDTHHTPPGLASEFAIGSQTFTVRSSGIFAANQSIIPGGPAVTINGTSVSLGKSDFAFGHRTETFGPAHRTSEVTTSEANIRTDTFQTSAFNVLSSEIGAPSLGLSGPAVSSPTHQSEASRTNGVVVWGFASWISMLLFLLEGARLWWDIRPVFDIG